MKVSKTIFTFAGLFALNACGGGNDLYESVPSTASTHINNKTKFSQSKYGVAASPRVTTSRNVKKGGGRRQVGKPYKIKGKWYRPKEDFGYDRKGQASWYGPNFHGRLTANGEVYDQYALSAAHPTFPLPSYARVTNMDNGKSVVVRVNDRGPYHAKRIIDLSAKGAELLGYQNKGIGNVRVQYIKQAPLHGLDHKYLMASYKNGGQFADAEPVKAIYQNSTIKNELLPDLNRLDRLSTGSIKKQRRRHGETDPFVRDLKAIHNQKDTGSTLALRMRNQFIIEK